VMGVSVLKPDTFWSSFTIIGHWKFLLASKNSFKSQGGDEVIKSIAKHLLTFFASFCILSYPINDKEMVFDWVQSKTGPYAKRVHRYMTKGLDKAGESSRNFSKKLFSNSLPTTPYKKTEEDILHSRLSGIKKIVRKPRAHTEDKYTEAELKELQNLIEQSE